MEQRCTISPLKRRARLTGGLLTTLSITFLFAVTSLLPGCGAIPPTSPYIAPVATPPMPSIPPQTQVVTASWYGAGMSGRRTSSGEAFNPNDLTAASRSLPMGSYVRVTNVSNGRSVVVRINDRGPYIRGRSIDLSQAAAERIGLTGPGVGRVELAQADDLSAPPPLPAPSVSRVLYSPLPRIPITYIPMAALWSVRIWQPVPVRHRSRVRRHHRSSQVRIVSNPFGYWLASALPHF
jgi:rare lipoprotein A